MAIVLFEDEIVDQLSPITLGRPAYAVTCGALRLVDLVAEDQPLLGLVRPHLRELQAIEYPQVAGFERLRLEETNLWVNARLVPTLAARGFWLDLRRQRPPKLVKVQDQLAVAWLPYQLHGPFSSEDPVVVAQQLRAVTDTLPLEQTSAVTLFDYPHQVIHWHPRLIAEALEWRMARGQFHEVAEGVFAASGATFASHVATDTRHGPILIDAGVSVGPFTVLEGPIYIGPGSHINQHAALRRGVYLGPTTKLGGEVESSVMEGFSNKQHHGFLGHSYLGSWINLGAGTSNSDLKNTYGPINVEYGQRKVDTGMQFLGCIMGDYSKSAVNTSIFTGKLIGCCSMMYGFVTSNVPSFTNYARSFGQLTELSPAVLAETQRRMFQRRGMEQQGHHVRLLEAMYQLSEHERRLASRPLSL